MRNLEIMDKQFLKRNLTCFKRGQTVNKNIQIVKEINKKQEVRCELRCKYIYSKPD